MSGLLAGRYAKAVVGQIGQAAIGLIVLGVLARILGPTDFGVTVVLTAIVTIATVALAAGVQAAALVISAGSPDDRAEMHGASAAISLAIFALSLPIGLVLVAQLAATLSPTLQAAVLVATVARLAPTIYISLVAASLSGAGAIGWTSVLAISGTIGTAAAPALALASQDRLLGAVSGILVGNLLTAGMALWIGLHVLGLGWPRGAALWRRVVSIGLPLHAGTIAYWIMLRADAIAVNLLVGGASVGTYGLALTLSERIGMVASPVYVATASVVSGPDRMSALRATLLAVRIELLFALAALVGTIVVGPAIVLLVAGPAFADSFAPLAILVVGAALLPVWPTVGLLLVAQADGAWLTARVQIAVCLVALVGYTVSIPTVGVVGAAIVSTGSYLLLVALGLWLVHGRIGFAARELVPRAQDVRQFGQVIGRALGRTSENRPSQSP